MSRQGSDAMEKLAEESEIHRNFLLPPLPIQPASQQYEANFRETMGIVGSEGLDDQKITRMLGAQSLWDATMAHSITKALYRYVDFSYYLLRIVNKQLIMFKTPQILYHFFEPKPSSDGSVNSFSC